MRGPLTPLSPILAQLLILAATGFLAWGVTRSVVGAANPLAAWFGPPEEASREAPPRVGGLALIAGLLAVVGLAQILAGPLHRWAALTPDAIPPLRFAGYVVLVVGAFAIGWLDDRRLLPRAASVALVVILAVGAATMDLGLRQIALPRLGPVDIPWVGAVALAALWLVLVMLAVNFLDGSDGVAGRQATWFALALLFCTVNAVWRFDLALVAVALWGASAGFLSHNLPGAPRRVLLGNSGSLALGAAMAGALLLLAANDLRYLGERAFHDNLLTAGIVLALPIYEFLRAMISRMARKESLLAPSEDALLQRYRRAVGGDHAATVRFVEPFLITFAILGAVATRFDDPPDPSSQRMVLVLLLAASACTLYRLKVRRQERKAAGED